MMKRRDFVRNVSGITATLGLMPLAAYPRLSGTRTATIKIMTVLGPITADQLGVTLIHEHLMADFIGAAETGPHRFDLEEVVETVLPYLLQLKEAGCNTFVECTGTFLGRDPLVAKRLSEASGLHIITNTGNYAAMEGKFLPDYVYTDTAEQLAERWILEWEEGIGDSGVYPGIIKISVDEGPLIPVTQKLLEASAIAHLHTGLTISAHTGNGVAVMEELEILAARGVDLSAFRWVHAQAEKNKNLYLEAAQTGAYIEFDGIRPENIQEHLDCVRFMKDNGLLHKTLISQDAGWYWVGEPGGGNFSPYTHIFELFIPALKKAGFTDADIDQLLVRNPLESLLIGVRRK